MNVNVSYNGFSLADAASCVMMRLPVPDLVWDMEALWKVWNEPIPAITPEAVPEPAPEPVRRRRGQCFAAKPVTYAGKEYPSVEALSRATGINSRSWLYRIRHNIPLEAPWGKGGNKQEKPAAPEPEAAEPAPEQKPASSPQKFRLEHSTCRQRLAAGLPLEEPEKLDGDLAGMRQIKTTPASDLKAYRMRFRACRYGGKKYTSLSSLADLADCTIGQAYKAVMASGKWIAEDEI